MKPFNFFEQCVFYINITVADSASFPGYHIESMLTLGTKLALIQIFDNIVVNPVTLFVWQIK